ncbi:MAG TPA: hypothetical protein DEQ30_02995 [Porphyromonadaceae bacterium]|nr:hypothetical protein [Porphyromonadaceae bacterium]
MRMQKVTVVSTPSISDIDILFTSWISIEGNVSKTRSDFYSFLSQSSVERDMFLYDHTVESYEDVKGNIVVLKVTPL